MAVPFLMNERTILFASHHKSSFRLSSIQETGVASHSNLCTTWNDCLRNDYFLFVCCLRDSYCSAQGIHNARQYGNESKELHSSYCELVLSTLYVVSWEAKVLTRHYCQKAHTNHITGHLAGYPYYMVQCEYCTRCPVEAETPHAYHNNYN